MNIFVFLKLEAWDNNVENENKNSEKILDRRIKFIFFALF